MTEDKSHGNGGGAELPDALIRAIREPDESPWPPDDTTIAYALGHAEPDEELEVIQALARSRSYRQHMLELREEAEVGASIQPGPKLEAVLAYRLGPPERARKVNFWRGWAVAATAAAAVLLVVDLRGIVERRSSVTTPPSGVGQTPVPSDHPAPTTPENPLLAIGTTLELKSTTRGSATEPTIDWEAARGPVVLQVPPLLKVGRDALVRVRILEDGKVPLAERSVINGSLTRADGRGGLVLSDVRALLGPQKEYLLRIEWPDSGAVHRDEEFWFRTGPASAR